MTLVFLCLSSTFFEDHCGSKQTNNPKIYTLLHRGNAKLFCSRSVPIGIIDTVDETNLTSDRSNVLQCSEKKKSKKNTKGIHISPAAFPSSLSLSLLAIERVLTGIAKERQRVIERW